MQAIVGLLGVACALLLRDVVTRRDAAVAVIAGGVLAITPERPAMSQAAPPGAAGVAADAALTMERR